MEKRNENIFFLIFTEFQEFSTFRRNFFLLTVTTWDQYYKTLSVVIYDRNDSRITIYYRNDSGQYYKNERKS